MPSVVLRTAAALLVAGAAWSTGTAKAEESRGTVLANTCFSCHGTDGRSAGAMPSIDGKSADYIADTLKRFRDGGKAGTVMPRIAKGFTDAEIDALAAYFSGSK